ncbi:MAG: elongation factor EF-2, partial [Candidatus Micrarchaeota archaeon]|nr:elongation factor EF-2 [Candidatus Micrarchaeota archaeon]
ILIPQEYLSEVITIVQGRRGQVLDIQQEGEQATVIAKMPVSEMFGFSDSLRSATQGRAIPYQEYEGYENLPKELLDKTIQSIRKRKGLPLEVPKPQDFMD